VWCWTARLRRKKKSAQQLAAAEARRKMEEYNRHVRTLIESGTLPPKFLPASAAALLGESPQLPMPVSDASGGGVHVRQYVTQELDPELDKLVATMLQKLWAFQVRAVNKDAVKGRNRGKRVVTGLYSALDLV